MGRFDNVNPSSLKSGAEKCISDLNNRDFRNWYSEFQSTKYWRDYHKSAIETLLQYINDYYDNMQEALDVLPPMADLIQEYKELEKELEQLKREYASAAPEERESILYQIEAVENQMESILSEIESLSNTTVTTSFAKEVDIYLYNNEPIVINDSYIRNSHSDYDKIVYNLENLYQYFSGHSELGGARNSYVSNITHQIGTIFSNMMEVFKEGQERWKVFDQAFDEAEHNLEKYIADFEVKPFGNKTTDYDYGSVDAEDSKIESEHKEKDEWEKGSVTVQDSYLESNTEQTFEETGAKSVATEYASLDASVDATPEMEQSAMSKEDSLSMNSGYANNELEKSGNMTTESTKLDAEFTDPSLELDEAKKIDTDSYKLKSEMEDIQLPEEKDKIEFEDNRIHIDDFEATAEERLNEGRINIEDQKTTAEYESKYDF